MFDAMCLIRFALQCAMMKAVDRLWHSVGACLRQPACVLHAIQCVVVIILHLMKCHDMFDAMCLIGFAQLLENIPKAMQATDGRTAL